MTPLTADQRAKEIAQAYDAWWRMMARERPEMFVEKAFEAGFRIADALNAVALSALQAPGASAGKSE